MKDDRLAQLMTPALLLDRDRLRANAARLAGRIGALGGTLRPHVKTHKSAEVMRDIVAAGHTRGITVSTLKEAEYFFANGFDDVLYAVGIAPNKFNQVADLMHRGCVVQVILDSIEMAGALAAFARARQLEVPVLIELDTDGHRAGTNPEGSALLEIGRLLHECEGTRLDGVMTHAGESYNCSTPEALLAIARQERDRSIVAAQRLRASGVPCPVVSIGSTPTAFAIDHLAGVTEVRAGVYALFDLVMAGVGVCTPGDIAISVLVTVTGHQREKGWVITDGGWMAMSRDRGTASQAIDCGYGTVLDAAGKPIPGLFMSGANQEHGIISAREGQVLDPDDYPLGSQLRILPNHACATAAQHDVFHVLQGGAPVAIWNKSGGW